MGSASNYMWCDGTAGPGCSVIAMVTAMKDGKRDEARALSQQLRATKDEPDMLAQDLCDE